MVKQKTSVTEKGIIDSIPKWALPAVLVFTAILYSKTLQSGLTSFDDDFYIPKNPFLKDFSWNGIKAIFTSFYAGNYHPLTTLTYLFEYMLYGLNPLPYHLLNVVLHLVNILLVFKLTESISGKKITALVACILFAVHPMHVESVAWISERKDVLYTMFYLSALLVYLRYTASGLKIKLYLYTILLFTLSLLSKSAAVSFPVILLVIDLYKGRKINKSVLLEKVPFFILSVLFGILNIMAQHAQGALADMSGYNTLNRLCLFTSSLSFYIIKLIAPFQLSAMHFFPQIDNDTLPVLFYCSLPFIFIIGWLVARKNNFRKEILFGVSFFLVTIFPMLQIIPVGSIMTAERYTYIPYIGLFYIVGQFIATYPKFDKIAIGAFSLFILLFSVQTWQRIGVWKNDETLFTDIINNDTPHSNAISMGYFDRGSERLKKGNVQGAMDDFNESVLLCPKYANAFFNRGFLYFDAGNFRSAISDFSKAVELNPGSALVYNTRGWAFEQIQQRDSAILDYNKSISLDSNYDMAYYYKGFTLFKLRDTSNACAYWTKASALGNADAKKMTQTYCH